MVAQEDSGVGTQGVGPEENIVPEEVITASEEAIENKKAMEMDSVAEETVIDDAVAESTGSDESSTEESGETEIEAAKGSSEIRDEKTESVEVVLIPPEEIETEDGDEIIVLSDDSLVPETPETSELPDAEKVAGKPPVWTVSQQFFLWAFCNSDLRQVQCWPGAISGLAEPNGK